MFQGKGKPLSAAGLEAAGRALNVGLPALWAVMTVETKGCGFLSDRRPVILFERHIFSRRTQRRFDAVAPDLSNSKAGGYGAVGDAQYEKLGRAIKLDRRAALESASWGLGQIMGFNAAVAGFPDVEEMVRAMTDSEDAQFQGMVGFIQNSGLGGYLQQNDWKSFAYRYNGADFQKNRYDTKLAQAHARYLAGPLPNLTVRAAQLYLSYLRYVPGGVDGWYGTNTQKAILRFQSARGLPTTGQLDATTFSVLEQLALEYDPD